MSRARSTTAPAARARPGRSSPHAGRLLLGVLLAACGGSTPSGEKVEKAEKAGQPAPSGATPAEAASPSRASAPEIHVNTSGDQTYHHLQLDVRAGDLVTSGPLMDREMAYAFTSGGQFEIYLQPAAIGVPSPDCTGGIIVRMPWTNPELPDAEPTVKTKRALFDALVEVREGRRDAQPVVLELEPYVEVAHDDPRDVSLTQCNVFFRYAHASYAYVDHVGPLAPT